jgi:hypothetical protein
MSESSQMISERSPLQSCLMPSHGLPPILPSGAAAEGFYSVCSRLSCMVERTCIAHNVLKAGEIFSVEEAR